MPLSQRRCRAQRRLDPGPNSPLATSHWGTSGVRLIRWLEFEIWGLLAEYGEKDEPLTGYSGELLHQISFGK